MQDVACCAWSVYFSFTSFISVTVIIDHAVCSSCTRLTSSVVTKCDPCMIWAKSHSNPKVLFTFQFGSRIVPLLREQDLRKSRASIASQPTPFTSSLCFHLVLSLSLLSLAVGLQQDAGNYCSFLSFGLRGCDCIWFCPSSRLWVLKEDFFFLMCVFITIWED